MKILGISFGRKMRCGDIMVKEALFKANEAGAEVQFINTMNMNIQHCKACAACSKGRANGKQVKCIIKDDYNELENAILDADAIIIAAPVYAVGIVGQFKNLVDRFCPMHDKAALIEEQNKRIAEGKTGEELLDPRVLKDRYIGYISVGGASTQNWVALGLPMMHLFGFSTEMKVVGHIDALDQGRKASPLLDQTLMDQCGRLGKALAEAVGKPYSEVPWVGEEGTCPVCHLNLLTMNGTTDVECPICGITGELSIEGKQVKVEFSQEQQKRARNTLKGLYEHYHEIAGMKDVAIPKLKAAENILPGLLEKYEKFDEIVHQKA